MELPIDHFRLLGVNPSTDAQAVLHTLEQRLSRAPGQGFSQETLDARAELLRFSADLLSDADRRADYESRLTTPVDPDADHPTHEVEGLDVPPSREVAGLLLLLEAGEPLDCFTAACRCLQPPQAPVLGSSREADLTLLAAHSCLEAAEEYRHERRYEAAARLLQEGLQLLQRMERLPDLRIRLTQELERLAPYRVLDLLSRDLTATEDRAEGVELLEDLVRNRGGLEGDEDPHFSQNEFQLFFKQIRGFLTVQEQVDLFHRWAEDGSEAADFLETTALTASGFAQRKPERIAAARDQLEASGRSGIDPLLANLNLLLGDVETARTQFDQGASEELRAWAERQSRDPLGQLCAYCRDWLTRDVLPGYRDLEAEADLEAYFSDRDVVKYVEQDDLRRGRSFGGLSPGALDGAGLGEGLSKDFSSKDFSSGFGQEFSSSSGADLFSSGGTGSAFRDLDVSSGVSAPAAPAQADGPAKDASAAPRRGSGGSRPAFRRLLPAAIAALALVLVGTWWLRSRSPEPTGAADPAAETPPAKPPQASKPATSKKLTAITSPSPTADQLQALLNAWQTSKAAVLGGEPMPPELDRIAREGMIARLKAERQRDQSSGHTQTVKAEIRDLTISQRSAGRIAVSAEIAYGDSLNDRDGKTIKRTGPTTLRNTYVFGRDDGRWRLAAFSPAN